MTGPVHPLWRPFEQPTDEEIAQARVSARSPEQVVVVDDDPDWPAAFERVAEQVRAALGPAALAVAHVGSTAVPGLPAKPVLDIDLTVPDSADEAAYLPALEARGFVLRVREPEWEEHRLLHRAEPDRGLSTHLHVFSPGSGEPRRHLLFRDWLRSHPEDRDAYAAHKRAVAARGFTDGMHYNNAKAAFVYDLYERIFAADPEHPHTPQPREG